VVERRITGADLIPQLQTVIDDITGQGAVYLVNLGSVDPSSPVIRGLVSPAGELVFVLGRPDDLGRVFGLNDEEYGWPAPVQVADVVTVDDVAPGYRRHPVLFRGKECVAMSVSWWEYEQLCRGRRSDDERGRSGAREGTG
jgi:hypothetical protein